MTRPIPERKAFFGGGPASADRGKASAHRGKDSAHRGKDSAHRGKASAHRGKASADLDLDPCLLEKRAEVTSGHARRVRKLTHGVDRSNRGRRAERRSRELDEGWAPDSPSLSPSLSVSLSPSLSPSRSPSGAAHQSSEHPPGTASPVSENDARITKSVPSQLDVPDNVALSVWAHW